MSELPERVVVGANGAYWRDFGTHYSMCPVSDDNDPVEVVATYVRLPSPDERQVGLRECPVCEHPAHVTPCPVAPPPPPHCPCLFRGRDATDERQVGLREALDLDNIDELLAMYDLPAKEPYLLPASVVNAIPSLIAALRQADAALAAQVQAALCPEHRAMGFTYTVLGCPRCYPALAVPAQEERLECAACARGDLDTHGEHIAKGKVMEP